MLLACLTALLCSCEKDSTTTSNSRAGGKGSILIMTMQPNPDGNSGTSFIQLIEDLTPKTVDNKTAIPVPFGILPVIHNNDIYIFPGYVSDAKSEVVKYSRIANQLQRTGSIALPANSGAMNIAFLNDQTAFITMSMLGRIMVINPQKMVQIGEIDLSQYGVGDKNPDPSSLIIRDNLIYIGLNQMVGGWFPTPDRATSDVAIVDAITYKPIKMISESTSRISTATRPADPNSIFMDEKKDIYLIGAAAFGRYGSQHKTGILRIKEGETEFDKAYSWNITDMIINGEKYKTDWIEIVKYVGNGKLYAYANFPSYYQNQSQPNFVTDKSALALEIDLYTKQIKKLPLPHSSSYGISIGSYNGLITFGNFNQNDNGFYTYNPSNGDVSKEAVVKTHGYPFGIYNFENN